MKKIDIVLEKDLGDKGIWQFFAKQNCNQCYGRGFVGFNITHNEPQPCNCLKLKINKPKENEKTEEVTILTPNSGGSDE